MKRPNKDLRKRLIRLSIFSAQKRRRLRKYTKSSNKFVSPAEIIKAPKRFNLLLGAGKEVVKFLKAVSYRVLVQNKPVKLNFKETESFYVPGAILLFSEINRIIELSNLPKPIKIIDPYRRKPREVLKQIEIHQLTGDRCEVIPTQHDVVFWKATKGADQTGEYLGPILEFVTERSNQSHMKQVEVGGIWRGVSEAVSNVVDHAYEYPRDDGFQGGIETKWWMFTQIREQRFTAAVCDLGCGYRKTINQNIPESFITKFQELMFGENPDAMAINIAMEYGRSGTKKDNRGKGSRDALSVLSSHGQGELTILSNTGWLQYKILNGQENVTRGHLGVDINGTIIWWNLPLKEEPND